ncbi:MAG TPA: glycosyltransferase, partial [Ilumatobacteraceae bacterium]|nr:glycosyltransferase [Ilumatobacteraceae bacterium]
ELATVGAPAIVVPWAGAADDHQTDNAAVLGDVGGAIVRSEADLVSRGLLGDVDALIGDPERLAAIGAAAFAAGDAHRSGRLTDLIERVAAAR